MHSPLRRRIVVGAATLAVAAFGGGAYAATQSGANARQKFLDDVAKRLSVSPAQLKSALQGAFDDRLQAAVAAGRITQAQANALKQDIQQRGGAPLGFGGMHRRHGGPRMFGPAGHPPLGAPGGRVSAAASYLGLSESQLFDQLSQGKSLAQIAAAQKKPISGLKSAISDAIKARLDKAVAAKWLTSAQEQKILSGLPSILDAQINRKGFEPRFGPPGLQRHSGRRPSRLYPGFVPAAPGAPPAPGVLF